MSTQHAFRLAIPSKTFLLGEYLILTNGPAIVLNSSPHFELHCQAGNAELTGIHVDSPAGKFYQAHKNILSGWQFEFIDAHQQRGGFGASSAQFAALYLLVTWLQLHDSMPTNNDINKLLQQLDIEKLLYEYRQCAWNQQGYPPSGADVIAQLFGDICVFDKQQNTVTTLQWPFQDICYGLIHTGNKLATHEHLTNLQMLNTDDMQQITQYALQALRTADAKRFCQAINQYQEELLQQKLVATATQDILSQLRELPGILACKGCGALGADVVLFLVQRSHVKQTLQQLAKLNLNLVACDNSAALGTRRLSS